jgi:purine/pyrimidine-nucleoside phosphorylase
MKHNTYFEGKVQSLAITEPEGPATVGAMEAGSYTFSTSSEERMAIVAGRVRVRLPDQGWNEYAAGQGFIVPPNVSFEIVADLDSAYVCRYR